MPIDYFAIIYLERPDGGTVELVIDDTLRTEFSTKGSSMQVRRFAVKLARKSHIYTVHPKGDGVVRIYGAEFLLGEYGVTVEGISIRGARLDNLDRNRDGHWQQSLELLSPDAVIVFFGANSSGYDSLPSWFKHSSKKTLLSLNGILPDSASRVVISTLDRAVRDESGVHTKAVIPELVAAQKFAAQGAGWAFLDAYRALGGEGAFAAWYKLEKPLVSGDLTHLSPKGANIVGNILGIAFLNQLTDYLRVENPVMALPTRKIVADRNLSAEAKTQ